MMCTASKYDVGEEDDMGDKQIQDWNLIRIYDVVMWFL